METNRRGEGRYRARYAFGKQVLTMRTRAALTQSALATAIRVHRRTVQGWETGESYPKAATLQRLLAVFLQHRAFTEGNEHAEAQALWDQAAPDGRRSIATFDDAWFSHALASSVESAPLVPPTSTDDRRHASNPAPARPQVIVDWGETIAVPTLYGREHELGTLHDWVVDDRCRVVAIVGLGGMGKSSLTMTLARQVLLQFDVVLFRSLRNGPPLAEVLDQTIRAVSEQQATPPDQLPAKLATLVQLLRQRRCLLILDNFESIMQPGVVTGTYRSGYVDYGELLRTLCERDHRSCLLLTSREKPTEFGPHEGRTAPVRTLPLTGLCQPACERILAARDITGTADQVRALSRLYGGNPLALLLVADPIRELFGGDVAAFLALGHAFFNGVGQLLAQHFSRSTVLEQSILYWLAIGREPVSLSELQAQVGGAVPQRDVLVALESLRRRMLIERAADRPAFTLQPVILEFVTEQLVEETHHELVVEQLRLFHSHALVHASAKEYVRHSQEQLIAASLLERVTKASGDAAGLERRLLRLLASWREQPRQEQGYGPGNVINLLRLLRGHLRGLDLAGLAIRQAYLAEVDAQDTRLVDAHLTETVLAEAFDFPSAVALSGDGALLAAGTSTGQVWLWRVVERTALWRAQGHTGAVGGVALSADGQLVVSGGLDGTVRLWEAGSERPLATFEGHTGGVWEVALSADGQLVVSGGDDGAVKLWEASSGGLLATFEGHTGGVRGVALSADGQLVASSGEDGTVCLWEASSGQPLWRVQGHSTGFTTVALSADGRLVTSSGLDKTVCLWEASSGGLLATFEGHTGGVWGVAISADGQLVASSDEDGMVRLWEAGSDRPLWTLQGHTVGVWGVALSADGQLVASAGEDGTVRLWEASSGRPLWTLQGHTAGVWGVALSADGQLVASGGMDAMVRLWEAGSGRPLATFKGHTGGVWGVALSADGQLVASSDEDGVVKLWEASSGRILATFEGHTGRVDDVALSADGHLVASGSTDRTVRLWEIGSEQPLATFEGHTGAIRGVAVSADGQLVASGGDDGAVKLWEAGSEQPLTTFEGHSGGVWRVALSSDGQLVASGGRDGMVKVWEAGRERPLATFEGHTGGVWEVALSADGQLVASGGADATVRLWAVGSEQPLATFEGHTGAIRSVAISADGQLVASGGDDGAVTLWEVKRGVSLRALRAERRYERMDISGLTGITAAQRATLIALGAVDRPLTSTPALASTRPSEADRPPRRDQQG